MWRKLDILQADKPENKPGSASNFQILRLYSGTLTRILRSNLV